MVQHGHVSEGVIQVVGVGWVVLLHPGFREEALQVEDVVLWLGLIIHTVKAIHLAESWWSVLEPQLGPRPASLPSPCPRPRLTCSRKRCSSGWLAGCTVASNSGRKMFSSISWKLASWPLVRYTSLQGRQDTSRCRAGSRTARGRAVMRSTSLNHSGERGTSGETRLDRPWVGLGGPSWHSECLVWLLKA